MKARDVAAAAVLAGLPLAAWLAPSPAGAELKLGPNAGAYLQGFHPTYEIEGLLATRWATRDASVNLPLVASGPLEVSFRAARVLRAAQVEVGVSGRPLDRFEAHGGVFFTRTARFDAGPAPLPLDVRFVTTSEDASPRGLRFDWIRVAPQADGRVRPSRWALAATASLTAGLFALLRLVGHGTAAAALLSVPASATASAGILFDPFALAHIVGRLFLPALALLVPAALLLRRQAGGRWALVALALALLGRGAVLVHPRSYDPDFGNARRFILALAETQGGLAERTVAAQEKTNVGYPRIIAGKAYAFPYSPLFFLPALWPEDADRIEAWYRVAGLVPASLEVLAVFLIARLGFPRSDLIPAVAPVLAAFLPPLMSRLLLAMSITLWGHLADVLLVAATLAYLGRPSRSCLALVFGAALASQLLYVSSLFTVSAFLVCLAVLERRHAWRLLAALGASAAITVLWLYHPFLRAFLGEILPAVMSGARMEARGPAATGGLGPALARIPLFYGWAWPLVSLAGLALARARGPSASSSVLTAHALAFALLVALRGLGGGLFRDLKEVEFAAPLVAVTSAVALEALARRRVLAALLVGAGLALFGIGKAVGYVAEYASPFTAL